jgi:hypothetical protein
MRIRSLLIAPLLLSPAAAAARDVETCASLYRQLNNAPQVIGNTGDIRRYTQELSERNGDIRKLRIEMRRAGCGSGSIVVVGRSRDAGCQDMQQELRSLEQSRESLADERNKLRPLVRSSQERAPIVAVLRENSCTPSDLDEQSHVEDQERTKVRGLALPQDDAYSGITDLRSAPVQQSRQAAAEPPPPPDRPYDPDKKVRTVGPAFFPEQDIDLANPKRDGPQPQQ